MAVATYNNNEAHIYQFSNTSSKFEQYQTIQVRLVSSCHGDRQAIQLENPRKFKFTSFDGAYFLGATDNVAVTSLNKWDGSNFQPFQKVTLLTPEELAFYFYNGTSYMAIIAYGSTASAV